MMRTLLWLFGGVLLGLLIHLVVILALPNLATRDLWTNIEALNAKNIVMHIDVPGPGEPNPLGLDPKLAHAICQLDLREGPGVVAGMLPDAFWSISVFDRNGISIYSTTHRAGIGQVLNLGIFDDAQTRLLAEQQFEIEEGLLIVESPTQDVFVSVRLAPPHSTMMPRYKEALDALRCGTIEIAAPVEIEVPDDGFGPAPRLER